MKKVFVFLCGVAVGVICLLPMMFKGSDEHQVLTFNGQGGVEDSNHFRFFTNNGYEFFTISGNEVFSGSLDQREVSSIPEGMCKIAQFVPNGRISWVNSELFTVSDGFMVQEFEKREDPYSHFVLVDNKTDMAKLKRDIRLTIVRKSNAEARKAKMMIWETEPNCACSVCSISVIWDPNVVISDVPTVPKNPWDFQGDDRPTTVGERQSYR